jgi:hypothetical protein
MFETPLAGASAAVARVRRRTRARRWPAWAAACALAVFAPACATGASGLHAIVDQKVGCLLGASSRAGWIRSEQAAPQVAAGQTYDLFTLEGFAGTARGAAARSAGDACPQTMTVPLSVKKPPRAHTIALAAPSWTPIPRRVQRLAADQGPYQAAVREILEAHGLRAPKVQITQVLRVDLDGDGVDEVLISASRPASVEDLAPSAAAGDYSLVLLRRVVGGRVVTVALHEQYHVKEGEFDAPDIYTVAAIADLDGDGGMEIVTTGSYYEGEVTDVFSLREGKLTNVLTCGCGQ